MKLHHALAVTFFMLIFAQNADTQAGILSGPITNPGNGHTYYLLDNIPASSNPNPFDAGQAEAQSLGGNLATINDAAENAWVFGTFDAIADAATPASGVKSLLLGLSDSVTEGTFEWISGEPLVYTNWDPGQPQGSVIGEDYVGIALTSNPFVGASKWHDIGFGFGDVVYSVVEVVPEPSSTMLLASSVLFLHGYRKRSVKRRQL